MKHDTADGSVEGRLSVMIVAHVEKIPAADMIVRAALDRTAPRNQKAQAGSSKERPGKRTQDQAGGGGSNDSKKPKTRDDHKDVIVID